MRGGQAIPTFDYDLAPYVAKSYVRHVATYLEAHHFGVKCLTKELLKEGFIKPLDKYIMKNKTITDIRGKCAIFDTLYEYLQANGYEPRMFMDDDQQQCMLEYADMCTERETYQAMEATVHNLCTLASRAGAQVPFSSLNLGTCTSDEGRRVTRNLLLAVEAGLGYGETAIFPISIFKLKKGVNRNINDPNYDLYRLALRVTAKRLFPNFINLDAPFNLKYYKKGKPETEVTAMGCVCGAETSIWKIDDAVHVLAFSDMYKVLQDKLCVTKFSDVSSYFDIEHSDIKLSVWDSDANEFVKVKKFIVNSNVRNWRRVTFTNGRTIVVTGDHPLPVKNRGRVLVDELHIGDEIPITSQYPSIDAQHEYSNINYYWLLGMLICDGALFNTSAVISVGADETDLVSQIIQHAHVLSEPSDSFKVSFVHQQRGAKGNYYDVRISGVKRFKRIIAEFGDSLKKFRHIPSSILDSTTREEKLAFMAGMIDADGYVNAARTNSRVQIGSTNKKLALGQLLIAEYLGLQAKLYQNHYNATDKVRYRVEFFVSEELASYIRCGKKKKLCQGYAGKCPESNTCTVSSIVSTSLPMYSYDVETESDRFDFSGIQSHNCRTRTIGNIHDPSKEVVTGRGNLFFTTINLPYIALEALQCTDEHDELIDIFFKKLEQRLKDVVDFSMDRFNLIAKRKAKNYPFLMGQHLYVGSENLLPDDEVREVIKHGSMTAGFIGLAETLVVLTGKHHGESAVAQELGLKIVKFMYDYMNKVAEETKLNFGIMGSPAEGCSGRLLKLTRKKFGTIPGVTDKEYFTNSFHVEVAYEISAYDKIQIEAPYHQYCPAGQISYLELNSDAVSNIDAMETLVNAMCDSGMGYFAINHPVDRDPVCGYVGYFPDGVCPRCGRKEGEGVPVSKLLSLRSYSPDPEYDARKEISGSKVTLNLVK